MNLRMDDHHFYIDLSFWENVWSLHRSLTIPLDHIRGIKHELPKTSWKELRAPGTFLPGLIKAGTYYTPRGKEFWYVTRGNKQPLTIELQNEKYKRIVLTVPEGMKLPSIV